MYKYNISYDSFYHYFLNLVKKKASISCGTGVCSQVLHFQSILLHNTAMFRTQITNMCMYITVSNYVERTY